jgi:hypothetical protein
LRGAFELAFEKSCDELLGRWGYNLLQTYMRDASEFHRRLPELSKCLCATDKRVDLISKLRTDSKVYNFLFHVHGLNKLCKES